MNKEIQIGTTGIEESSFEACFLLFFSSFFLHGEQTGFDIPFSPFMPHINWFCEIFPVNFNLQE